VVLNAQTEKVIDSASIIFKAKLLTLDKEGISDVAGILNSVNKNKANFLKTKYDSFIFISVNDKEPYRGWYDSNSGCKYYLAFNKKSAKFYRLGGFDVVDIDDFIKDLEEQEVIIFRDLGGGNEIEGIDIYCLYNYYEMKPRKRFKKGFKCFSKCSEEIVTKIGKPH